MRKKRRHLKNYYREFSTPWWRAVLFAAGCAGAAWLTVRVLGSMDISRPVEPAGFLVVFAMLGAAIALCAGLARVRSFPMSAAVSIAAACSVFVAAHDGSYQRFKAAVYQNTHNGVMYGLLADDPGRDAIIDRWRTLDREDLSREYISYRLGVDAGGGFGDYLDLLARTGYARSDGAARWTDVRGGAVLVDWSMQGAALLVISVLGGLLGAGVTVLRTSGGLRADLPVISALFDDRPNLWPALRAHIDPDTVDRDGRFFLMRMVEGDNFYGAFRLLERGAETGVEDRKGDTPLHAAARLNRVEHARLLAISGADVNARNGRSETPLHMAASARGSEAVVVLLIKSGADVEAVDRRGFTPMATACAAGGSETTLSLLAEAGAEPTRAMAAAVAGGRTELVRRLATLGAEPGIRDGAGNTLLHLASERSGPEMVLCLLEMGLDPDEPNGRGVTPRDLMAARAGVAFDDLTRWQGRVS
jgi:ankyrin repeat protein